MKHTYKVIGMTCVGCEADVKSALSNLKEVTAVDVDLDKEEAIVEMTTHVSVEKLQQTLLLAGLHYTIKLGTANKNEAKEPESGNGKATYACPMYCEGDKTYDEPGDCPVCGMHLKEKVVEYTCPMHPEVASDKPGNCPKCKMKLVPKDSKELDKGQVKPQHRSEEHTSELQSH